jgi:hypothetical protein
MPKIFMSDLNVVQNPRPQERGNQDETQESDPVQGIHAAGERLRIPRHQSRTLRLGTTGTCVLHGTLS